MSNLPVPDGVHYPQQVTERRRTTTTTVVEEIERITTPIVDAPLPARYIDAGGYDLHHAPIRTPTARALPAPEWYADQSGLYELRYWDGNAWTDHVRIPRRLELSNVREMHRPTVFEIARGVDCCQPGVWAYWRRVRTTVFVLALVTGFFLTCWAAATKPEAFVAAIVAAIAAVLILVRARGSGPMVCPRHE